MTLEGSVFLDTDITEIEIPASVVSIGNNAFVLSANFSMVTLSSTLFNTLSSNLTNYFGTNPIEYYDVANLQTQLNP